MKINIEYMVDGPIQITYGTDNSVNIERTLLPEIFEWCRENMPTVEIGDGGYNISNHTYYTHIYTKCVEDVMAFKLRWSE